MTIGLRQPGRRRVAGDWGELARCGSPVIVVVEVASMPTGASLIESCDSVIEAAAPPGQPVVLWHFEGLLGWRHPRSRSAGRVAGV